MVESHAPLLYLLWSVVVKFPGNNWDSKDAISLLKCLKEWRVLTFQPTNTTEMPYYKIVQSYIFKSIMTELITVYIYYRLTV